MTLAIILPAAIASAAGILMMTPPMRRRAAERGMSESIAIPLIIGGVGFVSLVGGLLL